MRRESLLFYVYDEVYYHIPDSSVETLIGLTLACCFYDPVSMSYTYRKKRGISTKNKRFTSLKRMLEKRADYCQLPAETTSLARLPATIIEIALRFSHPSPTHSTRDEIEPALHQLIKWLFMKSVPEMLSFDISCPSTSCHLSI